MTVVEIFHFEPQMPTSWWRKRVNQGIVRENRILTKVSRNPFDRFFSVWTKVNRLVPKNKLNRKVEGVLK